MVQISKKHQPLSTTSIPGNPESSLKPVKNTLASVDIVSRPSNKVLACSVKMSMNALGYLICKSVHVVAILAL